MKLLSRIALVAAIAVPVLAACTKDNGGDTKVAVTGVTLNQTNVEMAAGANTTVTLTATVAPENATNKNVSWTVADNSIVSINPNGANCTLSAGNVGTTTVTVTTEDGGKTAVCTVTVKNSVIEPTFVTISEEEATIAVEGTIQLTAEVFPENASDKSVTWSSSDENIATVDETGLVTGVASGTATITVTTNVGGKTAACAIKVAGMAKLKLDAAWFTTNAAMTYVSMAKVGDPVVETDMTDTDEYGFGTPDWFNDLAEEKMAARTADLGLISNMWDDNLETCFHTNIDWGAPHSSWGNREDVDFGQHNLVLTFPSNYSKVRIVLTANTIKTQYMNAAGEMTDCDGGPRCFGKSSDEGVAGFVLYWSADGEEFVKFDNGDDIIEGKVDCPDYGSVADVTLEATEAVPSIAALKIENQRGNDWTHCESAFGIAELEVYAE